MTVGNKMHQTLANLEGVLADLKTYALETEDQNAKAQFSGYVNQLDDIVKGLKGRIGYLESQEPQYRVFARAQGKKQ